MDARPHLDGKLLLALAGAAVAGILFWNTWPLYPFKLLVVLMHESGHAAATLLMGGSVDSIRVSPDQGGLTLSRIPPSLLREIVIASAGYLGSAVSACVLLWLAARSREGRWPLVALAAWCALVAALYVRDGFTLMFVGGCAFALGILARYGPALLRRAVLVFLAAFSACYALYDIRDDLLHLRSWSGGTDADALAKLTFIPAIVWAVVWGALSLALVVFTLRRVLVSSRTAAPVTSTL
ncbi:MAG TPA: M50 family metallopeptidase [Myxococcales bacterium]|nr:M50 family metallopeptidase [Myxococcales bacterium]